MTLLACKNDKLLTINSLPVGMEKEVQTLIEKNLLEIFGIHFLATEYGFMGGRIDTLGVDPDGSPVIFEYKRRQTDVVSQSVFYARWLKGQKKNFLKS